jgi:hypothetical protein
MKNNKTIKRLDPKRTLEIQKCVKVLKKHYGHSSKHCESVQCLKINFIDDHMRACHSKPTCSICKQFLSLISVHSRTCDNGNCTIPYCDDFKRVAVRQSKMVSVELCIKNFNMLRKKLFLTRKS